MTEEQKPPPFVCHATSYAAVVESPIGGAVRYGSCLQ